MRRMRPRPEPVERDGELNPEGVLDCAERPRKTCCAERASIAATVCWAQAAQELKLNEKADKVGGTRNVCTCRGAAEKRVGRYANQL
jgi:hypothetical protein